MILALAVFAVAMPLTLHLMDDSQRAEGDPMPAGVVTWVRSGGPNVTDIRLDSPSETLVYAFTIDATPGPRYLAVTIPKELRFVGYPTELTNSLNIASTSTSSDVSGNTTLTINFKTVAMGPQSLNISVAPNTDQVYGGQVLTISSEIYNIDSLGTILNGTNNMTLALLQRNGSPAVIPTAMKAVSPTSVYNGGIEMQMGLQLNYNAGIDYYTYSLSSMRIKNFDVVIDLNQLQVDALGNGSFVSLSTYCSGLATTIDAVIDVNVALTNSSHSFYNGTFDYTGGVISFTAENYFLYFHLYPFYATFDLPTGAIIKFNDAMFDFSAYQNGVLVTAAKIDKTTTTTTYFTGPTTQFTIASPLMSTDLIVQMVSTPSEMLSDGSEQEFFRMFVINGPYDLKDLTFTIEIPAGMTITKIRLPVRNAYSTEDGQINKYEGPVTITHGLNTQSLTTYNGWTTLTTPIYGGGSGTTFTVTIAEMDKGEKIYYSTSALYALTYGIRFQGTLDATYIHGSTALVRILTAGITAEIAGVTQTITDPATGNNDLTLSIVDKKRIDALMQSLYLLNGSGTTLTSAIEPGDVFEIRTGTTGPRYPYTSMDMTLRDPVFYFTIPDMFVGAVSGSQTITMADLTLSGSALGGYNLGNIVITNLGHARIDAGFGDCYVVKISFPGVAMTGDTALVAVGIKLTLSNSYAGGAQILSLPQTTALLGTANASTLGMGQSYASSYVDAISTFVAGSYDDIAGDGTTVRLICRGTGNVQISPKAIAEMIVGIDVDASDGNDDFLYFNPNAAGMYPAMKAGYSGKYQAIIRNNTMIPISGGIGYFVLPYNISLPMDITSALTEVSAGGASVTAYYTTDPSGSINVASGVAGGSDGASWALYSSGLLPAGITALKFVVTTLPASSLYTATLDFNLPPVTGGGTYAYGVDAVGATAYYLGSAFPVGKTAALEVVESDVPTITFPSAHPSAPTNGLFTANTNVEKTLGSTAYAWDWCLVTDDLMTLHPGVILFEVSLDKSASTVAFVPLAGGATQNWTFLTFPGISNAVEGTYTFTYVTTADTDNQTGTATRTVTVQSTVNRIFFEIDPAGSGSVTVMNTAGATIGSPATATGDYVDVPLGVTSVVIVATGTGTNNLKEFAVKPYVSLSPPTISYINPTTFGISEVMEVKATFIDNSTGDYPTITVTPGYDGTTVLSVPSLSLTATLAPTATSTAYSVTVNKNDAVTLTATASGGYAFNGWGGVLAAFGTVSPLNVAMDVSKVTSTSFAANTLGDRVTLSITAGANGITTVFDPVSMTAPLELAPSVTPYTVTMDKDDPVTLTATANATYAFSGWSGSFSGRGTQSPITEIIDVSGKTATTVFGSGTGKSTITVTGGANGTTTVDPATGTPVTLVNGVPTTFTVNTNASVTLTAVANGTYAFDGWVGDFSARGTQSPITEVVNTNKTASTAFSAVGTRVTLKVTAGPNGITTVDPATGTPVTLVNGTETTFTVNQGASVTLTAAADGTYAFDGWSGSFSARGTQSPITETMNTDKVVSATFSAAGTRVTLTVTGGANGTTTVDPATGTPVTLINGTPTTFTVNQNALVTLTAAANGTYAFDGWSGSFSSCGTQSPITEIMNGNKTATTAFSTVGTRVTLTVTGGANGTTTVDPATGTPVTLVNGVPTTFTVNQNALVTLTAAANGTYAFDGWSGSFSARGTQSPITEVMNTNKTASTTFSTAGTRVTLTVTGGANGITTVDPATGTPVTLVNGTPTTFTISGGATAILTAVANGTYAFGGWTGNFSSYGTVSPLEVTMDAPKTTSTSFPSNTSGNRVTLSVTGGANGTTSVKAPNMTSAYALTPSTPYTVTVNLNETITLSAAANPSFAFDGWMGADLSVYGTLSPLDVIMDTSKTTSTSFSSAGTRVTLTITAGANGITTVYEQNMASPKTLAPSAVPYTVTVNLNSRITLTAAANPSFAFDGWSGGLASFGGLSPIEFEMNSSKITSTSFTNNSSGNRVALTITPGADGTTTVYEPNMAASEILTPLTVYTVTVDKNDTVTLTATANATFAFDGWGGNLSTYGTISPLNVVMDASKTTSTSFSPAGTRVTLTITAGTDGVTAVSTPNGMYALVPSATAYDITVDLNDTITLTATADPGFAFDGWGGSLSSFGTLSPLNVVMDASKTTSATFTADPMGTRVTLTITGGTDGTTTVYEPSMGAPLTLIPLTVYAVTVNLNDVITLTADADPTFAFKGWESSLSSYGTASPLNVTMDSSKTTATTFAPATNSGTSYTITSSSDESSSISPKGKINALAGSNHTFTFSADPGHSIISVTVDGVQLSQNAIALGSYTFYNVMANHTIVVAATPGEPREVSTLTIRMEGKGYAEYSIDGGAPQRYTSSVTIPYICDLTVTAYPADGYSFKEWKDGNKTVKTSTISFEDLESSKTLTLRFESESSIPWLMIAIVIAAIAAAALILLLLFRRKSG